MLFRSGPRAAENAAQFDTVFCGSTWCLNRLRERGIHNAKVLIQGVDPEVFSPCEPRKPDGEFRIFSGGKFEHRKGQDLVIAAFTEFVKIEPSAHLVASWFNPWPQLIPLPAGKTQAQHFSDLCIGAGISPVNFTILPHLRQHELAGAMADTDAGLFPNRCEGGTNLVLMEYAAMSRKVIANAMTGHADVRDAIDFLIPACEDRAPDRYRWAFDEVGDIVAQLRDAFARRFEPKSAPPAWSWDDTAEKVADAVREITHGR